MNFAWLNPLLEEMQYDEIKIIGRNVHLWGKPCHAAALLRQGEKVQLCIFMQAEFPETGDQKFMRDILKSQALSMEQPGIRCLRLEDLSLEVSGWTGYYMQDLTPEVFAYLFLLVQAGWRMPADSGLYEMDWKNLMAEVYDFHGSFSRLPAMDQGAVSITWGPQYRNYLIEKPLTLRITDAQKGITGEQELSFAINEADGAGDLDDSADVKQEGICYINSVKLVDVWKELEECYEDPEYQKRALASITKEQFEEVKRHTFQILEQECPKGMCYAQIEYESTLDVSLDFYSRDYLESRPKAAKGSASFLLMSYKPEKETGSHGLKMQASVIRVPMKPDTIEIRAELFSARRLIPEREETFE